MGKFRGALKRSFIFLFTIILCIGVLFPVLPIETAKAATQSMTLYTYKDKFVDDSGGHSFQFGIDDTEIVAGKTSTNGISHAMMQFDLSSVPGKITSASLEFFVCSDYLSSYMDIYGSYLDEWTETNSVAATADVLLVDDVRANCGSKTFNVTSFVQSENDIDQTVTFVFTVANESRNNSYSILSRESSYRPYLRISYEIPPSVNTNTGLTLNEGDSGIITSSNLSSTDDEDGASNVTYTITDLPGNGTLYDNSATLGMGGMFTQADIDNNLITYTHDGGDTTSDSFKFSVSDSMGSTLTNQTFSITVNAVDDDAPTIAINNGLTVDEGTSGSLQTQIVATDTEDTDANLKFTVTDTPDNGTLSLATFTQAQLDAGSVTYTHDDSDTTSDSFIFKVEDASGNELTGQTFSITVNSIDDDAPTIAVNNGLKVDEGASGSLQTQLVATDTEDTDANLTFTVTDAPLNGMLSLSTFTQAQLDAGSVTYTHDDSDTISDSFIFKVEDTNGNELIDQTFSITVNPIDDTPPTPTPTPGSNTRTITGKLVDSDGNPMAGCIVELHSDPITTITDDSGMFAFHNVEYTNHTLKIKKNSGLQLAAYALEFAEGSAFDSTVSDTAVQITYTQNTVAVDITMSKSDEDDVVIDDVDGVTNPSTGNDELLVLVIAAVLLGIIIGVWTLRRYVFN